MFPSRYGMGALYEILEADLVYCTFLSLPECCGLSEAFFPRFRIFFGWSSKRTDPRGETEARRDAVITEAVINGLGITFEGISGTTTSDGVEKLSF